jgi:4-hydroxy-4-methyl-2-oxoglutarate aldolase
MKNEDFNRLEKVLYSAVLADILDELGVTNSALDHRIRPLVPGTVVMGTAFTILATDVYEQPREPYQLELEAVDSIAPGNVVVAVTNGSTASGFWGELLTTAAMGHGCRGVILDGLTRDAAKIIAMDFPLFVRGFCPYDSKGRTDVIAYQVPVRSGDAWINPGDIVLADYDGAVAIPQKMAAAVIEKAREKIKGENKVKEELLSGMSAREVFAKYHIL